MYLLHMVWYGRKLFSYMYILYRYVDHTPSSIAWHLTTAGVQNLMVKSLATQVAIILK